MHEQWRDGDRHRNEQFPWERVMVNDEEIRGDENRDGAMANNGAVTNA